MLSELRIENFALIDRLEIHLRDGLNVLTGETGAGKSIIIDAVSLLLGGRGSQEFIRSGAPKAVVEGVFSLESDTPVYGRLALLGYEPEDGCVVLSRELSSSGRNVCRVQGRTVPLSLYKEMGALLIDIHGQHDYQSLLRQETHLDLLDSLGEETDSPREQVSNLAETILDLRRKLDEFAADDKDLARREDMLRFQLDEIASARLELGEEEELIQERARLVNAEKLASLSALAYERLFAGFERQKAAFDLTGTVVAHLRELAAIDPDITGLLESLESCYYQMEEAAHDLRNYQDSIVFDTQRQEYVEDRLALVKSLKRKYGNSIGEIKAFYEEAAAELDSLARQEERVLELQNSLAGQEQTYRRLAEILTVERQAVALRLEAAVTRELADLYMPDTKFKVEFSKREKVHKSGQDVVEFMFSPNPGEPLKPLAKTASGGELSRIILALKALLAKVDPVPTLIFDEVDSGVGGQAVRKVAEKLARIGENRQVLCVTHSPHLASFAASHFYIIKDIVEGRTVTKVHPLSPEERKVELARMLGGTTKFTLDHAEELLKTAKLEIINKNTGNP